MKKTLFFGLIAAALGFTACSSEDDAILGENTQKKGMVLNATVEQPAETRATINNLAANWQFAFAQNDEIAVTNSAVTSGTYYTFTNDGTNFKSTDATPTATAAGWFAYFPSNSIDLTNQAGTLASVANLYALAGTTASATTGADGLTIPMSAKVAILKIENSKGTINIQVKTSASYYVTGLTAKNGQADFDVSKSTTATSLFTTSTTGTYYVAVPAGVQLSVKDGNDVLKSTKAEGLAAGKYYNLTIAAAPTTTGTAKATIDGSEVDVNWVQLWAGGPKFAEKNVGASSVTDKGTAMRFTNAVKEGADYVWGSNWCTPSKTDLEHLMTAAKGQTDDKVKCEHVAVSGTYGFKFTGKTASYTNNSVFFPVQDSNGYARYWSGTASGNNAWRMYLSFDADGWGSKWAEEAQYMKHLVRPVLKEN